MSAGQLDHFTPLTSDATQRKSGVFAWKIHALHASSRPMIFERLDLRTYRQGSDRFWEVRNSGILVYWPHGVGDWVFLSYILPLLEPSNKYFVTRSGDDTVALFDGSQAASPVYSGFDSTQTSDGAEVNL